MTALTFYLTAYYLKLFDLMVFFQQPGPGDALKTKVNKLTEQITPITEPLAVLAFILVGLSWVALPLNSEWAQSNKGAIRSVMFGIFLIFLAPTLGSWMTAVAK